ncbi:MAG TPA: endonuclease/exonuclease/phosphatase family protein [Lacunisphaera sp.]
MFARLESQVYRLRRRLSRSEWAIKHLGLTPSEGTSEEPGVLLIQIDGLGRTQLEQAIAKGRMPFLRRLLKSRTYEPHTFYPGIPTTTAAVQAELFYGLRGAVPGFAFFRRDKRELGRMLYPSWAKDFEAGYAARADGLLKGGSSWSNIYTGGAGQNEAHFCAASNGLGDMWQTGKIGNILIFLLLHIPSVLRITALLLLETGIGLWDALGGIRRGQPVGHELLVVASRVFVAIGLRELVTMGAAVDLARGLPIIHVNFLGYDEQAHGRGPGSLFAHWSLQGIDRSIKALYRAAHRSSRRDYAVWIMSDHGQERTRSFATEYPGGIEEVIRGCYDAARQRDRAWRARSQRRDYGLWLAHGPWSQRRLERIRAADTLTAEEQETFTVVAVGPVGHVYFSKPLDDAQRAALAKRLVEQGKVPGVLVKQADGRITWFHDKGTTSVPDEVPAMLPHAESMRAEIARDLVDFCANPDTGDLVLLGWSPGSGTWTFAPERGAHGGVAIEETQGFVLLPVRTPLPPGTQDFIRPTALRQAALYHLGREKLVRPPRVPAAEPEPALRIMTYNIHSCFGMDGRISPRRIARVIETQMPDIVALQEIDLGRRRSRAEDQAALIAGLLGMHYEFCPTVTVAEEHYGHAIFSPWPMEVVKRARLPLAPGRSGSEPRAAIWVRVNVAGRTLNVVTTHLGLGWNEGVAQCRALVGEEWLGGIPADEPVVLCGDFNLSPGGAGYRLLTSRLRDAQVALKGHGPLRTFSSIQPFMRIDHVMLSPQFEVTGVSVPRNDLTRVASDHLPLVIDVRALSSAAAASTTTRPQSAQHRPPTPAPVQA